MADILLGADTKVTSISVRQETSFSTTFWLLPEQCLALTFFNGEMKESSAVKLKSLAPSDSSGLLRTPSNFVSKSSTQNRVPKWSPAFGGIGHSSYNIESWKYLITYLVTYLHHPTPKSFLCISEVEFLTKDRPRPWTDECIHSGLLQRRFCNEDPMLTETKTCKDTKSQQSKWYGPSRRVQTRSKFPWN